MKAQNIIEKVFNKYLPNPFSIALILTIITFILAIFYGNKEISELALSWENGFWSKNLLVFSYQMMLILVLGHILVLSKPTDAFLNKLTSFVCDTKTAVLCVSVTTLMVTFLNWGIGLIFGALLTRKIGELAQQKGFKLNYPLVGAAAYSGLMIWHGGFSGSAPLKVNDKNHLASLFNSDKKAELIAQLPETISTSETILSIGNLSIFVLLLITIPLLFYILSKDKTKEKSILNLIDEQKEKELNSNKGTWFDKSSLFGKLIGFGILSIVIIKYGKDMMSLSFTLNNINLLLLSLGLIFHRNILDFLKATQQSISDISGILIQFPLYFGIMAIMNSSGLAENISVYFASISTETTLPIFTFISAAILNVFVPSGGGQWIVQGPLIIEAAINKGVELPKIVMALAYGDQLTNMLQPFWALPLLGITKLKAKDILPYSLLVMLLGIFVFVLGLIFLY